MDTLDDTPDTNPGDGVAKDANMHTSFRAAITEGNALTATQSRVTINFDITLPPGQTHGTILLGSALDELLNNFTIHGPTTWGLTLQRDPNAAGAFRIFTVLSDSTSTIDHLTLSGGQSTGAGVNGGGILNKGSLTLTSCDLTDNHTEADGGAVYNDAGASFEASLCNFYSNSATGVAPLVGEGGGIFSRGTQLSLDACQVYDNGADYGGGVYVVNGTCSISNSSAIWCNSASQGGGIYIQDCNSFTMSGGSLDHNTAVQYGGGLYVAGGSNLSLTGVSITYNQANGASGKGGGFYIAGGTVAFTDCNLSGNTATVLGPGGAKKAPGDYTRSGGTWDDTVVADTGGDM